MYPCTRQNIKWNILISQVSHRGTLTRDCNGWLAINKLSPGVQKINSCYSITVKGFIMENDISTFMINNTLTERFSEFSFLWLTLNQYMNSNSKHTNDCLPNSTHDRCNELTKTIPLTFIFNLQSCIVSCSNKIHIAYGSMSWPWHHASWTGDGIHAQASGTRSAMLIYDPHWRRYITIGLIWIRCTTPCSRKPVYQLSCSNGNKWHRG